MSTTEVPTNATGNTSVGRVDMKLETVVMVAEQTGEELPL